VENNNLNKSLLRAISVMKGFTPDESYLSTADIARKIGIPWTTAHRILSTLTSGELLEQDAKTSKYKIGRLFYILGSLYLATIDIVQVGELVVKALNDIADEAVSTSIYNNGYITVVISEETKHTFRWTTNVGHSYPAYATATGRAFLSEFNDTEIERLYPEERLQPLTPKTIKTKAELKAKIENIRKTGVSYDSEGLVLGIDAMAALIRNAKGNAVASLCFIVPTFRMNAKHVQLGKLIKLGSSLISYLLGYRNADNLVSNIEEIYSWWELNKVDSKLQES